LKSLGFFDKIAFAVFIAAGYLPCLMSFCMFSIFLGDKIDLNIMYDKKMTLEPIKTKIIN
jgi:hypothetical protein